MSRENFVVKLTALEGGAEYVTIGNIFRMREVPKAKYTEAHTILTGSDGFSIEVTETVAQIAAKGRSHGVLFVIGE